LCPCFLAETEKNLSCSKIYLVYAVEIKEAGNIKREAKGSQIHFKRANRQESYEDYTLVDYENEVPSSK